MAINKNAEQLDDSYALIFVKIVKKIRKNIKNNANRPLAMQSRWMNIFFMD